MVLHTGVLQVVQRPAVQQALRWRQGCLAAPGLMPMLLPAAFMVPLVAQALGYSDSRSKEVAASHSNAALMQNGLGLMQWLIVAAFVLYFVSYAVDVHQCASQDEQDAHSVRLLRVFIFLRSWFPTQPFLRHDFCLQVAEFKARLDKLKGQRAAFVEKKSMQRQQAGLDAGGAQGAGKTEDEKTVVKEGVGGTKEDKSKSE